MDIVDKYTHLDLGNVRYSLTGSDSDDLIVLMHGLTTSKDIYDDLTRYLVESKYLVLALDFFGRGKSDSIQPIDSEIVYAEQVVELIEKFIPFEMKKRIHLVGYSAGGAIASRVAYMLDKKTTSLTLIASTGLPNCIRSSKISEIMQEIYRKDAINQTKAEHFKEILFEDINYIQNDAMRVRLEQMLNSEKFWSHDMIQTIRGHLKVTGGYVGKYSLDEIFEEIGNLKIPTLIMNGLNDKWIKPECGRIINKAIKSSRLVEIEGASHWAFLEKPDIYLEEIIQFLSQTQEIFKPLTVN